MAVKYVIPRNKERVAIVQQMRRKIMIIKIKTVIFIGISFLLILQATMNALAQTSGQFDYQELSWSPDGKKISFTATQNKNTDIFIMNSDGTNLTKLTDDPAYDAYASWSPDGKKIAFGSNRGGKYGIYVVNADGSNLHRLTKENADYAFPSWAPDGKKIACMAKMDKETWQIYLMDTNGKNLRRITNNKANDYNPAWSPDGSTLAFESDRDGNDSDEIYTIKTNGRNEKRITRNNNEQINDVFPTWISKKQISISAVKNRQVGIFVMAMDGSNRQLLMEKASYGRWSPDKSKVAYISQGNKDLSPQIWIMNSDGSGRVQLTK